MRTSRAAVMASPLAFALLALFGALCAARGAFAVGDRCPGGLRTSCTTSRTSRARSRGRGQLRCGRIAFATYSPQPRPWACWCWLACRRVPCCRTDTWGCHHAAARRLADTCGRPPPACCCSPWVVRSWCAVNKSASRWHRRVHAKKPRKPSDFVFMEVCNVVTSDLI